MKLQAAKPDRPKGATFPRHTAELDALLRRLAGPRCTVVSKIEADYPNYGQQRRALVVRHNARFLVASRRPACLSIQAAIWPEADTTTAREFGGDSFRLLLTTSKFIEHVAKERKRPRGVGQNYCIQIQRAVGAGSAW